MRWSVPLRAGVDNIDDEKDEPDIDNIRLNDLKAVMQGVDPDIESGLANHGFFMKDRRMW